MDSSAKQQAKLGNGEQAKAWQAIKGNDKLLVKAIQEYEKLYPTSLPGKFRGHFDFVTFQEEHYKQSAKLQDKAPSSITVLDLRCHVRHNRYQGGCS
jgi:hypothetical protein